MTRTTSAALAAHLAGRAHTLAVMVRIDLANGETLALTDHDRVLAFDLGDGSADYEPWTGIMPSDVVLSAGFEVSNFELAGPLGATVTRTGVLGGKYRAAIVRLFVVNWADLSMGAARIMRGSVAVSRVEGSRFVFEVRNAMEAFQQTWGRVLSGICSAEFGDAQCTVARTPVAATVSAAGDGFRFTVDIGGDHPDDWFNLGTASFLTGDLAGTAEARIFDYDGATGAIELYEPLIAAPQVGDTLTLYRGCSRLLKSDDASLPTCLSYANVLNFRGFPEVPGSRQYHRVSAPGVSYA